MISNTDWDDFPMLFYYNPNNSYIVELGALKVGYRELRDTIERSREVDSWSICQKREQQSLRNPYRSFMRSLYE